MLSRFTAVGTTADEKEVILAYELKEDEFKVNLTIVPRKSLSAEEVTKLTKEWAEGGEFSFPADAVTVNPNLNSETVLPDDIRSDETGKIRIKQNEWAYQLLTVKLWESYLLELEELKNRAAALTQYDRALFDEAKSFWERVLEHRKGRDISQESLDKIKDDVNSIFEKLKTFRKSESAEFEAASAKARDEFNAKLEDIRKRAEGHPNYKALLEELKQLQAAARKARLTKADDTQLRKVCDAVFQHINEQRNHFFSDKTASRIKGLTDVIQKMEASLNRDKKDLEYLNRKTGNSVKQLELQLIKVKSNLLQEAIASKEAKLKDIYATMESLQQMSNRGQGKIKGEGKAVEEAGDGTPAAEQDAAQTDEATLPPSE